LIPNSLEASGAEFFRFSHYLLINAQQLTEKEKGERVKVFQVKTLEENL